MILCAYQYRFYPTEEQVEYLAKTFRCARFVYNYALNFANTQYQAGVKTKDQGWSARINPSETTNGIRLVKTRFQRATAY